MRGILVGVVAWVMLVGSGCEVSPEHDAREVCEVVCDCTSPLPSTNRQCNTDCVAALGPQPLPDECVECLLEASCHDWQYCVGLCN